MRNRSILSVGLSVLMAASVAVVGLVASPGVSQAANKKPPLYYLSLGDSYSVGYQPTDITNSSGVSTPGYTAYVAKKEKMQLENFGCGGATTASILYTIGCPGLTAATDAVPYPATTQAAAALAFINASANAGKVGLVTVAIGGNDVTKCAKQATITLILACVNTADASITTNVGSLVTSLDTALAAAGDTTAKVIGLTYPDVILGSWVNPGGTAGQSLATDSVAAFDFLINPTLSAAYGATNFVNVTTAPYKQATAGDDTPLTTTQKVKPYGVVPAAVAEICNLTYYCKQLNIHANTKGYKFIGKLIVAHLAA